MLLTRQRFTYPPTLELKSPIQYFAKAVNAHPGFIGQQSINMMGAVTHRDPVHIDFPRHGHIVFGIAYHDRLLCAGRKFQ